MNPDIPDNFKYPLYPHLALFQISLSAKQEDFSHRETENFTG